MDATVSTFEPSAAAELAALELGARVRLLRKHRGETGTEFGERIGLSAGKVSELEQGKYLPGLEVALKIETLSAEAGDPALAIDAADLNDQVRAARLACPCGQAADGDGALGVASA